MAPRQELDFQRREVALRADLSQQDERGLVCAPARFLMHGPRAPRPGEEVLLVDVRGAGTCLGTVASVSGWELCVRPDWDTWSGKGPAPRRAEPRDAAAPGRGARV